MITNETLIRSLTDDELVTAYHKFDAPCLCCPPEVRSLTIDERIALELIEMEIDARGMHL